MYETLGTVWQESGEARECEKPHRLNSATAAGADTAHLRRFDGSTFWVTDSLLPNLDALSNLAAADGGLEILYNDGLTDLGGLGAITFGGHFVDIRGSDALCQSAAEAFAEAVGATIMVRVTDNHGACG